MLASTRLFVGNLPVNIDEKELYSAFSSYGKISTLDVKSKPGTGNDSKKFAFISVSGSNADIESCIKHFSNEDFNGHRLYVTRARESFLERLQREREQTQNKAAEKLQIDQHVRESNLVIKLEDKLKPKKRKQSDDVHHRPKKHMKEEKEIKEHTPGGDVGCTNNLNFMKEADKKKSEADKKRMQSMLKKRQEFKEKQMIIKTGLTGIDKIKNKKVLFSDDNDITNSEIKHHTKEIPEKARNNLFDDDAEDDDEVNFEIKKQFEGKKGQKVLDLQSRYKTDKRFTLDERFVEDEEEEVKTQSDNEEVEIGTADEKAKQLDILQNVLGITIKSKVHETDSKRNKSKPGMLRFDPMQPDHTKFLVPVETKPVPSKKTKKKKDKQEEITKTEPEPDVPKVKVSKEQFYKVSETLKEAIAEPTTFSLRSLFENNGNDDAPQERNADYITLETHMERKKVKNPLDPTERNPFVYDSSDSETEEPDKGKSETVKEKMEPEQEKSIEMPITEIKAVWRENLFFSATDARLQDGLAFFSNTPVNEVQKDRRELKSLMKKRIYNKDRKNQMFKKKIGGRKKSMKKPYKNKN